MSIINIKMRKTASYLRHHWGISLLLGILFAVVCINFRPGYFILGNDNYSPELNPGLTVSRSLEDPAWRSYRVFGNPSDSEQADLFRAFTFGLLETFFPKWLVSQGYVFFALVTGSLSMAFLAGQLIHWVRENRMRQTLMFFSGFSYFANMVTSWMFNSPLMVFLAGYAFLPLLLWRLAVVFRHPTGLNYLLLFIAVIVHTTSSMVPTTFIVESGIILFFIVYLSMDFRHQLGKRRTGLVAAMSAVVIFGSQLFWILPFVQFVQSNAVALRETYINRSLTPQLVEDEATHNITSNTVRLFFSWMDIRNDDGTYQFPHYPRYLARDVAGLGYLLPALALAGYLFAFSKRARHTVMLSTLFFAGLILINGINPPFGSVFSFFQEHIPLFKQVFRWQSSKLYPLLTIPYAVFAGMGAVFFTALAEYAVRSQKKRVRSIAAILPGILISIGFIWFVLPYFTGGLINPENYVRVPGEYFELSKYLKKNDPDSRIMLVPAANTLYFRTHTWGFYGSSFLNYLIPNPIVEKALTTGSFENEDGMRVLENAYHSEDPSVFANALRYYRTPLVLFDRSTTRRHNGHSYSEDTARRSVFENPHLEPIWENGALTLYRLSGDMITEIATPVYSGHDWRRLGQLTVRGIPGPRNIYSARNIPGMILPFALTYDAVDVDDTSVTVSTVYRGPEAAYTVLADGEMLAKAPLGFRRSSGTELTFAAAVPTIRAGTGTLITSRDMHRIPLNEDSRFLVVNGEVYDLGINTTGMTVTDTAYRHAIGSFGLWKDAYRSISFGSGYREKYQAAAVVPSVAQFSATISADRPILLNICAFSATEQRCMNQAHAVYVRNEPAEIRFVVPRLIMATDTIEFYIALENAEYTKMLRLNDVTVRMYENPAGQPVALPVASEANLSRQATIRPGDRLTVSIPKIRGMNAYHFDGNSQALPPVVHAQCPGRGTEQYLRDYNSGPMVFRSEDCSDQVNLDLPILTPYDPQSLAFMYSDGSGRSGIPLFLSLRREKSSYPYFEDRLPYEGGEKKIAIFGLPDESISYTLQLYNYGTGSRPSVSELRELSFQVMPAVWASLSLIPEGMKPMPLSEVSEKPQNTPETAYIGSGWQSYHPNWRLVRAGGVGGSVRINGWAQGWIFEPEGYGKPYFWPNDLAYAGYVSFGVLTAFLLLWPVVQRVRKHPSARPSARSHR
jgi:hypothetical protein